MSVMIIFGAGASYGCDSPDSEYSEERLRPPLTDELFAQSRIVEYLDDCSELNACFTEIRRKIRGGVALEQVLLEFKEDAKNGIPNRDEQLKQIKIYLTRYLGHCSESFLLSGSNYHELCQQIISTKSEPIFVTFNYDTLLDEAIKSVYGKTLNSIDDYVKSNPFYVKVHGSWNWVQKSFGVIEIHSHNFTYNILRNNIKSISLPKWTNTVLGLPVKNDKTFALDEQIQILRKKLHSVDKIVVIGWRAEEPHFMELLKDALAGKTYRLHIVSRKEESIRAIEKKFISIGAPIVTSHVGDFNAFVESEAIKNIIKSF